MVSSLLLDIFRLFFLFSSFEPLSSFRLRSAPDAFALEDPFVLFADDARVLLLFAFEPPLPRVVVFVVGFRLRGEEFFEWCRRSSSSLLVSLKSFSAVFSSKDKFRTPSLREEGAFEFVPPIGAVCFFSRVLFFAFFWRVLRVRLLSRTRGRSREREANVRACFLCRRTSVKSRSLKQRLCVGGTRCEMYIYLFLSSNRNWSQMSVNALSYLGMKWSETMFLFNHKAVYASRLTSVYKA